MTNYEVPQNALLRNRFFYEFLLNNDRQIADEIRREYIDTLGKVYFSYFKAYSSKLMKLQVCSALIEPIMIIVSSSWMINPIRMMS